ncbi:MAG: thermonuclease family protein [Chitinophagaceae bacterium]|nr:thermonuclease family protein [Rubrivivax sp.]
MRTRFWMALWVAALAMAGAAYAAPANTAFEGKVVRVLDGATLAVRTAAKGEVLVRLRDIDPPELCQPWGAESMKGLIDLALGHNVRVQPAGRDGEGRVVARVLMDGVDLGPRQVEDGHAWSVRGRSDRGPLVKQERMAKALSRGLHAGGGAVLPKEFRSRHGPCAAGEAPAAGAQRG